MSSDPTELAASAPLALIVEDDPHAARVAEDMLRLLGYRSRIAEDAHQALYALAEGPPALILLDICLPEMDGVGLVRIMRRVQGMQAVPIVAASAIYPAEGPVARVLAEQGVSTYLTKPFMMAELRRAIDQARSVAMKFGPPPTPSMSDGRLQAVTDADIKAASAKTMAREPERIEPAPVAPPPPAPPRPPRTAPPPTPRFDPRMASRTAPPVSLDDRFTDTAESSRPSPWDSSISGSHPLPKAQDAATLAQEVVGVGETSSGDVKIVFERMSRGRARVRSTDAPLEVGQTLRVRMGHRIPVYDAMTDVEIRLLLRVTECEDFGRGSRAGCELSGAQPADSFDALVGWFAMR